MPATKDWKSTAIGVLSFLSITFLTITAFLSPYLLTAPASSQALIMKITAGLTLGSALVRAWLGWLTNNADAAATALAINQSSPPSSLPVTAASIASTPAAKVLVLLLILGGTCALMVGCTGWERSTFQTLSASKADLDQVQKDYEARTLPHTVPVYNAINKAKAAQTLAVQSMETYEEIKAAKGTATALQAQQAVVNAALAQLPVLIAAVKGLYTAPAVATPAPSGVSLYLPWYDTPPPARLPRVYQLLRA